MGGETKQREEKNSKTTLVLKAELAGCGEHPALFASSPL